MQKNEIGSIINIVTDAARLPPTIDWNVAAPVIGTSLIVGVGSYFILTKIFLRPTSRPSSSSNRKTEKSFRNVFSVMTAETRRNLIRYYQEKHECGREEAMQRAIDDRFQDVSKL